MSQLSVDPISSPTSPAVERPIAQIVKSITTLEGGGFKVRRPFPTQTLDHVDPFLLIDEGGPMDYGPGEAKGAPNHPHRGFETVSYFLEGSFQHKDSVGNSGLLQAGDVQWMTAGSGVIHDEMPSPELLQKGGRLHAMQIWVNLPARDKMIPPRYQDIPAARIPVVSSPDGQIQVKVIAGSAMGIEAVIETRTPIMYLHYTLQPGAEVEQAIPAEYNGMAYLLQGEAHFGSDSRLAVAGDLVIFAAGDFVRIHATGEQALSLLLLGGRPLNEPVARYGPFVMNTEAEIHQAFADYRAGRMGTIPGID